MSDARRDTRTSVSLLFWDFENTMSDRGISISVGIPSVPEVVSGFVSQTGGGPAETWGDDPGIVFLTRFLGSHDLFLWLTVTHPVLLAALTFRHWHNHNPGFPTCPSYRVQLQIDAGAGYKNLGKALTVSDRNCGGTDTIEVNRELKPGSYKLRWHPMGLKKSTNTNTEFFAIKHLQVEGHPLEKRFPEEGEF
jgi:hypothetical protein